MLKIVNPATEEVVADIPDDAGAVHAKVERARAAQPGWAAADRSRWLPEFRRLLLERKEKLARTLTSETGKPITQSRSELDGMLGRIDFFLDQAPRVLREEIVHHDPEGKLKERITHEPLGLVAGISAWNYPYYVGSNVFIPALLAGNAVLYKPSEHATLTGLAIRDLVWGAGVPESVFIPVVGDGRVGAELVEQAVQGVFFTGSYAAGKKVSEATAGRMVRLQTELGGKDPVYVTEDVDVAAAAAAVADGAFYNAGQSCCAVERIYVHRAVAAPFLEAFVAAVKGFIVGDPMNPGTYLGPLARRPQVAVLERQVADARKKGAKLLLGGKRIDRKGYFFEPTVLSGATHAMELMKEETFGPAVGIQEVEGDEEAIRLMNDTEYGLTAGVYSRDPKRAEPILARMNSGTVYWNCCDRVSPRLPWSGRGRSGVGVTLSTQGILAFTQPKAWHLIK